MINVVVISGRLTHDPELKHTKSEIPVTSFSVAVSKKGVNRNEENNADFFSIVAWKKNAEFICNYFKKGDMIELEGYLTTTSYQDKDGKKVTKTEITVNSAHFCGSKQNKDTEPYRQNLNDGDLPF